MVIALVLLVIGLMGTAWQAGHGMGRRDSAKELTAQASMYQQTIDAMTATSNRKQRELHAATEEIGHLKFKLHEKDRKIDSIRKRDFHRKPRFYKPAPPKAEDLRFKGEFREPKKRR